jgi:hypothetical protein
MPMSTLPEPPVTAAEIAPDAEPAECNLAPPEPARHRRPLPLWVRISVLVVGWLVLLIGVAGLVLPGIQGIATIIAGAAILSVSSDLAHRWMYQVLHRWPKVWCRVDRFRTKLHDRLHRMVHKTSPPERG